MRIRCPLAVCAAAASLLALSACGGSSKPKGYLDPDRLTRAIKAQVNAKLSSPTPSQQADLNAAGVKAGDTVDTAICILKPNSKREFDCKIELVSGYDENITILVAKDGQSYIGE